MKGTTQGGGGEIVQVDGGHILRATGRKDRHSKVYTSKGPRDRRVRLSAHTAIQFYDVQDRLGYDRPSKAVDWLIKKAKAAIDKLNELPPPWQHGGCSHTPTPDSNPSSSDLALDQQSEGVGGYEIINNSSNDNSNNNTNNNNSSFGEADVMNTMKSLFPTSSFAGFANDPSCQSSSFQAEDLGLSLQTNFNQPGNTSNLPFQESFQRLDGWNGGGGDHSRVGLLLNSLGASQQALFSQFGHRELLLSNAAATENNSWINQRPFILANHHDNHHPRTSKSSPNLETPFELGFRVPARIYGEEQPESHR